MAIRDMSYKRQLFKSSVGYHTPPFSDEIRMQQPKQILLRLNKK